MFYLIKGSNFNLEHTTFPVFLNVAVNPITQPLHQIIDPHIRATMANIILFVYSYYSSSDKYK